MLSPWDIIGWGILGAIALAAVAVFGAGAYFGGGLALDVLERRRLWAAHKDTSPEPGQRWEQGSSVLYITRIHDNGRIGIKCGNASWADTPEMWAERVQNRKLILLNPPEAS